MSSGEFPLSVEEAVALARQIVDERYPTARCAWLAGSVAAGRATATSDLDVTVLLPAEPAPMRESLMVDGIPVELFVHTEESLVHYRAKDRERRQPTMARLVAGGLVLLDLDERARDLAQGCLDDIMAGPDPLRGNQIDAERYRVSALVEDLVGAVDPIERAVVAAALWETAARLLLAVDRQWQGSGKGLLQALQVRDRALGDELGADLSQALADAGSRPEALADAARSVLDRCGGPLFEGYRVGGD